MIHNLVQGLMGQKNKATLNGSIIFTCIMLETTHSYSIFHQIFSIPPVISIEIYTPKI